MGFPLYPAILGVFMEAFEDMILSQATHKRLCWFCYMDDNFVIWPHGPEKLLRFVDHMNGLHRNKFTLETEKDDHFAYFTSTSVGHRMAPWAVMFTANLPTQAFTRNMDHVIIPTNKPFLQPCHTARMQEGSLHNELKSFKTTFRENGYRLKQTSCAHDPTVRTSKPKVKPTSVAILPFMQTRYGRPKKMLGKYSVKDISLPLRKICSFSPVKDDLGLRTVGTHSIPCEYGQGYIGRLVVLLRSYIMSTTGTYGLDRQTNRRW